MATIHVNRGATSLGAFPEEQVRESIRAGRFLPSDLGWKEGMASWQPLSQFAEFAGDFPAGAPAPAAPPTQTSSAAPGSTVVATTSVAPRSGLPWDERHTKGLFSAFIETLQMVLTRPAEAFTAMRREGGLGDPLLYAVIGGSAGGIVSFLFSMGIQSLGILGGNREHNPFAMMAGIGAGSILFIIFLPLLICIGL